jgi:large-conductance mechanosensitive channel
MLDTLLSFVQFIATVLSLAIVAVIVFYIVARIASAAFFNAKYDFIQRFRKGVPEDDSTGKKKKG